MNSIYRIDIPKTPPPLLSTAWSWNSEKKSRNSLHLSLKTIKMHVNYDGPGINHSNRWLVAC